MRYFSWILCLFFILVVGFFGSKQILTQVAYADGGSAPLWGTNVTINNVNVASAILVSAFNQTNVCLVLTADTNPVRCTVGSSNGTSPSAPTSSSGYYLGTGVPFKVPWNPALEVDCAPVSSSTDMSVAICSR